MGGTHRFFLSLGLRGTDVEIILSREPTIASLSPSSVIQPIVKVLKRIFHKEWNEVLLSYPAILLHSPDRLLAMYNALVKYTSEHSPHIPYKRKCY